VEEVTAGRAHPGALGGRLVRTVIIAVSVLATVNIAAAPAETPAEPAADLSEEITGGNGVFIGSASPTDFEGTGYFEREYVASGTASSYSSTGPLSADCLDTWVRTGKPPPKAPRIEVTSGEDPEVRRDGDGIATGGIRTPPVDVPVDVLSGVPGPNPSTICLLLGSTTPLPPERLAELYESEAEYLDRDRPATKATIEAGFALEADRDALLDYADPSRIAS